MGLGLSSRRWEGEGRCQVHVWDGFPDLDGFHSPPLPEPYALCATRCFNWSAAYIIEVIEYYSMSHSCCVTCCILSNGIYILAVQCDLTIVPESGSITVCSTAPMRAVAPGQVGRVEVSDITDVGEDVCHLLSAILVNCRIYVEEMY